MNIVSLENLSDDALSGFEDSCAVSNETALAAHNSAQSSKPENERTEFVPESVQSYADRMVENLGLRYEKQRIERRKAANIGVLEDAMKYLSQEQQDEVKAKIAAAKAALGV
jgi:hypothetical protein